jgi:glutaryl-CoA dehydrogenase
MKRATPAQVSMARNVQKCDPVRETRQMLSGMGITGEYRIMRHHEHESVLTYEGNDDVHLR